MVGQGRSGPVPGVLIVRLDAQLYYANALTVRDQIMQFIADADKPVRAVVIDAVAQDSLDITSSTIFKSLVGRLRDRGIELGDTILVTGRSGGRSAMAINALASAGFTGLYHIVDGMEGSEGEDSDSVFDGMRMKNGWTNSGLPWEYQIDPARMLLPPRHSRTFGAGNEHD